MGREIRRVAPNWDHPKNDEDRYRPLYDEDYETVITEWINNHNLWMAGQHPHQLNLDLATAKKYKYFAQYEGNPPDVEYYRPKWAPEEMTWFQLYETVSEGTPLTPPFATKEELVEYLVANGDFWYRKPWPRSNAERMVKEEWALSFVVDASTGRMAANEEALALLEKTKG